MDQSLLIGLVGLAALVALIAIRVPIAYSMILVGGIGTMVLTDPRIFLAQLKNLAYSQFSIYDLSVLPMFVLMGNIATREAGQTRPRRRRVAGHRLTSSAWRSLGGRASPAPCRRCPWP